MFFFSFSVCIVSVTLLVLLLWWYGFLGTLEHWHLSMGFFQLGVILLVFTSHMKLRKKGRRFDESKESQPLYPSFFMQFKCFIQNHQLVKNKARAWLSRDSMGFCYNVAGYVFGLSLIECYSFLSVFALLVSHFWFCYFGGMVSLAHLSVDIFQWAFSSLVSYCWFSRLTWNLKKRVGDLTKAKNLNRDIQDVLYKSSVICKITS